MTKIHISKTAIEYQNLQQIGHVHLGFCAYNCDDKRLNEKKASVYEIESNILSASFEYNTFINAVHESADRR